MINAIGEVRMYYGNQLRIYYYLDNIRQICTVNNYC